MSRPLLPLCSVPAVADRDGNAGANAKFLLPFYGYFMASGQILTFPNAVRKQRHTMRIGGSTMPDTYQKDCCTCSAEGANLLVAIPPQ